MLPWMLDGADEQAFAMMLAPMPEPLRTAYQNEWQPAYAAVDKWGTRTTG